MASLSARRLPGHGRYLLRSLVFLVALAVLVGLLGRPLLEGFSASPLLNGTILAVLLFGVVYTLAAQWNAFRIARTVERAGALVEESRRGGPPKHQVTETLFTLRPREVGEFLETVHRVLRQGEASATLPYLLDSLATRTEDRRALVRFLTGALILLGLIGTFWGLLVTIGGVREVLGGLTLEAGTEAAEVLAGLRERLGVPLGGMALAFSSSLFGLSASLALAFLELQLYHAQSDTHARMESLVVGSLVPLWQAPAAPGAAVRAAAPPGYSLALLETAAEHLERVTHQLEQFSGQESGRFTEATGRLASQVGELAATLERLEQDRTEVLKNELRVLTRTLAQRDASHAPEG